MHTALITPTAPTKAEKCPLSSIIAAKPADIPSLKAMDSKKPRFKTLPIKKLSSMLPIDIPFQVRSISTTLSAIKANASTIAALTFLSSVISISPNRIDVYTYRISIPRLMGDDKITYPIFSIQSVGLFIFFPNH